MVLRFSLYKNNENIHVVIPQHCYTSHNHWLKKSLSCCQAHLAIGEEGVVWEQDYLVSIIGTCACIVWVGCRQNCVVEEQSAMCKLAFVMPQWAEPQRHMVVIVSVCLYQATHTVGGQL